MFRVRTRTAGYSYLKTKLWRSLRQLTGEGKIIYWLSICGTTKKKISQLHPIAFLPQGRCFSWIFVAVKNMNRM